MQVVDRQQESLLYCLQFLMEYYGRPQSLENLRTELGLTSDQTFSEKQFIEVSERLDFSAELTERAIASLPNILLPCVLSLGGDRYCVLVKRDDSGYSIYAPELGEDLQTVSDEFLEESYSGAALLFRQVDSPRRTSEQWGLPETESWFWGALLSHAKIYALALLATLLLNIFILASPLFIMTVYDRVVPNSAFETLWVLSVGIIGISIFDFMVRSIRAYLVDFVGKRTDFLVSSELYKQVLALKMEVKQKMAGALANTIREFDQIRDFITSSTLTMIGDFPFVLLFIFVMVIIGGPLALVPVVAMPIVFIVSKIIQVPLSRVVKESFDETSKKNAHLFETLNAIETIKSAGIESWAEKSWETQVGKTANAQIKSRLLSSLVTHFAQFILAVSTVALVVVGVYEIDQGSMTLGALIACMILNSRVMVPLVQIAQLAIRYQHALAALKALNQIMKLPVERPLGKQFIRRKSLVGEVEFRELNFSYPEAPIEALRDISFSVKRAEKVGIVGRIGSGKSTLLKIAINLYQPQRGACLIDGLDVRQIDPFDLRHNVSFVQQDSILFNGTIRENITFGAPGIDDEAILTASRIAGVDYFIRLHPSGYDQIVGERGENLSGGQRQAVAIARALLLNPNILLLDEPTSQMDHTSEQLFITQLRKTLAEKTLLLVTHRTSLLNLVDRLIVVDRGEIVADGAKEDVLRKLTEH